MADQSTPVRDTGYVVCMMTASSVTEARTIAHALIEEGVAACCNIVAGVESIYRWQGAVESAAEILVIIKTSSERVRQVGERIKSLHSYDVPELIALPIIDGLPGYLAWIGESIGVAPASGGA